jgi:hypothetical protein
LIPAKKTGAWIHNGCGEGKEWFKTEIFTAVFILENEINQSFAGLNRRM